jgi:hypothetical protein
VEVSIGMRLPLDHGEDGGDEEDGSDGSEGGGTDGDPVRPSHQAASRPGQIISIPKKPRWVRSAFPDISSLMTPQIPTTRQAKSRKTVSHAFHKRSRSVHKP